VTLTVRRPRDAELVDAWSASAALEPVDRALALLAAFVDAPRDRLAELSPGQRDTLLCDARAALFGRSLELVASCPSCRERNALVVDVRELPRCVPDDSPVVVGERRFRLPDSRDLAAVAHEPDPERAARVLSKLFPSRTIVPIDASDLVWGMGTFHCITQQQPRAPPLA